MLRPVRFRVQNYRNIEDSGWIPIEKVTALVGRNESGKTALLKALHKFNPATSESYNPQREFPRDRYTRDFKHGKDWPVCAIAFELEDDAKAKCSAELDGAPMPQEVVCTRFYDGSLRFEFTPIVKDEPIDPRPLLRALEDFAKSSRRIAAPTPEQDEATQKLRADLASWAEAWRDKLTATADLRSAIKLLDSISTEAEQKAGPQSADAIEFLQATVKPLRSKAQRQPLKDRLWEAIRPLLPVFIYFENYGILDSAIYLPRFLEDQKHTPNDPKVRTIRAMFTHVQLSPEEITELGTEKVEIAKQAGQEITAELIASDQQRKELRSVKLNAASLDISKRFSDWWQQRRHEILYEADGNYFRIWVSDNRRPGVKIELESRSKGFQWFFSFYLVFLVESAEGHRNAILLLDEPGLNLHPTAQQELIGFFENLAEKNPLLYSTHSPFLIDGEHIHRIRPVTEDDKGHSHISIGEWPADRETIFPLQAAAGYAMVKALFQNKNNVLVEGMSDYYYLHALSTMCRRKSRSALADNAYITPCGGTKFMGHIASLFLGQNVRPIVLLDGDDAGRARRDSLQKELYSGHERSVLMLDSVLGASESEVEDILGEEILLPAIAAVVGNKLVLNDADRKVGSLPDQIKASANRKSLTLPEGWKAMTALHLVSTWAEKGTILPDSVLERAEKLFAELNQRFAN